MPSRIKVANPNRCIGCFSCMLACSRTNANSASLIDSAIDIRTSGGLESAFVITVCRACHDPPCARACPTGALTPREGGGVVFNKDLCEGNKACARPCLPGAINFNKSGLPLICIHCGVCSKFCSHDVLKLIKTEVL